MPLDKTRLLHAAAIQKMLRALAFEEAFSHSLRLVPKASGAGAGVVRVFNNWHREGMLLVVRCHNLFWTPEFRDLLEALKRQRLNTFGKFRT